MPRLLSSLPARTSVTRFRQPLLVLVFAVALAAVMTWPLLPRLTNSGRTDTADGMFSIWVVSWVAHALTTDPAGLYNANIFFPERDTLAYSEANLGAGVLAIPVWLATHNAYAALNSVAFLSFVLSALAMFALARHLTGDVAGSLTAAVVFAYCPFVFAHTAHIQLLMTAGLPLILLSLHRLTERPSPGRAIVLGLAIAFQALSCAYHGVLGAMLVSAGVVWFSVSLRLWRKREWWMAVGMATVVSIGLTLPFFMPYLEVQSSTGFARDIKEAAAYSADWRAWLSSAAWAHRWIREITGRSAEVLFPGFVALGFGIAGLVLALRRPRHDSVAPRLTRDVARFYAAVLVGLAWLSFGPSAGLYALLYHTVPLFDFLRAPGRIGIGVVLALAVFVAYAIAWLQHRWPAARWVGAAMVAVAVMDLCTVPYPMKDRIPRSSIYTALANDPPGVVVELPYYERRPDFPRHTLYMVNSTLHWFPLVNGYSDYASPSWRENATFLRAFPSENSLRLFEQLRGRYVILHGELYARSELAGVKARFAYFHDRLTLVAADGETELYELRR